MKALHHPDRADIALSTLLYALSDPIRLQIVESLATAGELPCGSLGADVSKPNMSYHLKILRESGLIRTRTEGTQRLNCLRREDLEARFPGLLETILRVGG